MILGWDVNTIATVGLRIAIIALLALLCIVAIHALSRLRRRVAACIRTS